MIYERMLKHPRVGGKSPKDSWEMRGEMYGVKTEWYYNR